MNDNKFTHKHAMCFIVGNGCGNILTVIYCKDKQIIGIMASNIYNLVCIYIVFTRSKVKITWVIFVKKWLILRIIYHRGFTC